MNTDMIPAAFMTEHLEEADVVLLGVPYEKTLSAMKGAAGGPEAICDQLKYQVEDLDHRLFDLTEERLIEMDDNQDPFGLENVIKIHERHLDDVRRLSPENMVQRVKLNALDLLKNGKFVVGLGGEHTVSLGLFQAVWEIHKDITVIVVDAHGDGRDDTTDYDPKPKKLAHSTVVRRIRDMGVEIRQIGIRSMSAKELVYAARNGFKRHIFFAHSWGGNYCNLLNSIKTEDVYLSIDVDGFDPSVIPTTGTPEPGGLPWHPFMFFAKELFASRNVRGFDLVEVSQKKGISLDNRARTAYAAALLLHQLLCFKFRKFCK
jgi:agmatinase